MEKMAGERARFGRVESYLSAMLRFDGISTFAAISLGKPAAS